MSVFAPVMLLGYALLTGLFGPQLLLRWRGLKRSPGAAIATWQILGLSTLMALTLAGVAVTVPALPVTNGLADLLEACADVLRAHYATPGGAATMTLGGLLALAVPARAVGCVAMALTRARRSASRQAQAARLLAVGGHPDAALLEVPSPDPVVYCLPGRRGAIVATTTALACLDPDQAAAVLAHERAHLRNRHHLVLTVAHGLRRGFGLLPLFRVAPAELASLVEMHADDHATRVHDRRVLATALLQLAIGRSPFGSLGATGAATLERARRLTGPARCLGPGAATAISAALLLMLIVPILLAALPAVATLAVHYCPVPW